MFDVKKVRKDFPMLSQTMQGKPLIFLDNSSTTFKPKTVIDATMRYYLSETSNSHRGDYDLCYNVDKIILNTRENVAKFINAKPHEIVFTSGASMSINLVAFGYGSKYLKSGDEILLTEAEHASNVLPWYKVCEMTGAKIKFIPLNKQGRLTLENVKKTITKKCKIIAVAEIGNVLGFKAPIKEICDYAHKHNILVMCDGAQSVPHHVTDVKNSGVDFLAFSGHKMCGPTGIGVLYGKYELLQKMDPLMSGGGMNAKFDMCGAVEYLEPPVRFEAGTQNIAGIYGLNEAIKYLSKLGMKNIEEYEEYLHSYAIKKLKTIKDLIIYNEKADSGIITVNKKNVFAQDEATYLNSLGIAVRSGQHCAKILMNFLKCIATIRISLYFYNTIDEIDRLVDALKKGDYLDAYFS